MIIKPYTLSSKAGERAIVSGKIKILNTFYKIIKAKAIYILKDCYMINQKIQWALEEGKTFGWKFSGLDAKVGCK